METHKRLTLLKICFSNCRLFLNSSKNSIEFTTAAELNADWYAGPLSASWMRHEVHYKSPEERSIVFCIQFVFLSVHLSSSMPSLCTPPDGQSKCPLMMMILMATTLIEEHSCNCELKLSKSAQTESAWKTTVHLLQRIGQPAIQSGLSCSRRFECLFRF